MSVSLAVIDELPRAIARLNDATAAKKCWGCGCFHSSLEAIGRAFPEVQRPAELDEALKAARQRLTQIKYDCLGCEVCYPPLAMNALNIDAEACPAEEVERREGWPPLPGAYTVLRYQGCVAVCTLTDDKLAAAIVSAAPQAVAIVGTLYTENLGIERIIHNIVANPNIRFLILFGPDSRQLIGHLPGQSFMALSAHGVDERQRIIGAAGKRPVLRNVNREAVEHFRRTVQVVDLVGTDDRSAILAAIDGCAARNPGPAKPFAGIPSIPILQGYIPERMVSDPAGYFVVYLDRQRQMLSLEHYANSGVLDTIIEGCTPAELYIQAVEKRLLSRLDHAAYLGRELARAEDALLSGQPYIQDAAPECQTTRPTSYAKTGSCGCGSSYGGLKP
jgi:tetrahydromethanopterin S-methyltransferase subunit A